MVRLAVMGVGMIGRRHVEQVLARPESTLAAIVDPNDAAREFAASLGAPWYPSLSAMLAVDRPDGVLVATPNQMHVAHGLECIAAGLPALIEKPIADDVDDATRLVDAAEQAGVPLLVGHHRRHNPLIAKARDIIASGRLGTIVSVHATCWFFKPEPYFDQAWRRQAGAGPVFMNLIHDIDLLRHLCGEIVSVQAIESNTIRGHQVEDSAVILLRFEAGALGTLNVSDTAVAPWSWEFTAGENPAYTHTDQACYLIGGTKGALEVPNLKIWHHQNRPDWWDPLLQEPVPVADADPLGLQIRNFCGVIRGIAAPVVSGREGLRTLKVIAAIKQAARSGRTAFLI